MRYDEVSDEVDGSEARDRFEYMIELRGVNLFFSGNRKSSPQSARNVRTEHD